MNINMFSIDFSSRIRLRTRLTLIRLTLIRNPESIGERVSHPLYRYLCLHFLFKPLQHNLRYTFGADLNAPLPIFRSHSFGNLLDARLFSAPNHSTSELLRTL